MRLRICLLGLICAALCACGGGGGSATTTSFARAVPTPAVNFAGNPPLVPSQNIYLGAFANNGDGVAPEVQLGTLETQIGRRLALSMHYYGWTSDFPNQDEETDAQLGRIPVISWNCGIPNSDVAAGLGDANIVAHANALRAYGKPVFLRYQWEMNNEVVSSHRAACYDPSTDEPGGFESPTEFIAAWNRIHAIFVAQGATNVAFLWNPSAAGLVSSAVAFYPGGSTVDWVGIDEYDRSDLPFAGAFSLYNAVKNFNKPIMIAETGANPPFQGTFFSGAAATLQTYFPAVKAFIYFDAAGDFNWRLTATGLSAFAAFANQPYMSALP